jgi:pre-60S factor REI1
MLDYKAESENQQDAHSRQDTSSESREEDEEEEDEEATAPDFVAEQCLFCDTSSDDFDKNMIHMASTHSFIVPYQDSLVVDLQTLVWYFHFVIYGYHECIQCGTRRNSLEAVQQHMFGKGHCRFDLSDELADFYDLSRLDKRALAADNDDDAIARLASGRIISQRGSQQASYRPRNPIASTNSESTSNELTAVRNGPESQQLTKSERRLASVQRDLAQLSVRDRMALAHLPAHEQRAVLVVRRKQTEKAMRAERRGRLAEEKKANKVLQARFRADGPGRKNG